MASDHTSHHDERGGDNPGGEVGVDRDVAGHVASPEPVHAVQHPHLPPVTPGVDVEQDEVLEDLATDGGVALHELHLLHLRHEQCDVVNCYSVRILPLYSAVC